MFIYSCCLIFNCIKSIGRNNGFDWGVFIGNVGIVYRQYCIIDWKH